MSLRIVLTVDEGEAAELIGLLAKALARGELGLLEFRLEAFEAPPKRLPPPRQAAPIKKRRRGRYGLLGGERFAAVRILLEKGPVTHGQMIEAFVKANFAANGLGSAVKQWQQFGLIEKIGPNRYALKAQEPTP